MIFYDRLRDLMMHWYTCQASLKRCQISSWRLKLSCVVSIDSSAHLEFNYVIFKTIWRFFFLHLHLPRANQDTCFDELFLYHPWQNEDGVTISPLFSVIIWWLSRLVFRREVNYFREEGTLGIEPQRWQAKIKHMYYTIKY